MSNTALARARAAIEQFLPITEGRYAMTPAAWKTAKTLTHKLPPGLDPELVRALYEKVATVTLFPGFSPEMPAEYFPIYGRFRIAASQAAMARDVSEDLVSETSYLFNCGNEEELRSFSHIDCDSPEEARRFVVRQRLVETHKRYVAIPNFKIDRFQPLAQEPLILEAARSTLGNDWFLARCARAERGETKYPYFDIMLWAACKFVLQLAGETVTERGPGGTLPRVTSAS